MRLSDPRTGRPYDKRTTVEEVRDDLLALVLEFESTLAHWDAHYDGTQNEYIFGDSECDAAAACFLNEMHRWRLRDRLPRPSPKSALSRLLSPPPPVPDRSLVDAAGARR